MEFLIAHWHCILPLAGILAGLFLMREKPQSDADGSDKAAWRTAKRADESERSR